MRQGVRHIAVAHTQDDQVETVLHRIIRGTGISGLAGIPGVRPINDAVSLIRPFLSIEKKEILAYLKERKQEYRIDSSNQTCQWTRNRIRLEILPLLQRELNPNVSRSILRLAEQAGECSQVIETQVRELKNQVVLHSSEHELLLDWKRLTSESAFWVREVLVSLWEEKQWPLRLMGFEQWDNLSKMTPPRKRNFPGQVEVVYDEKKETLLLKRTVDAAGTPQTNQKT